VIAKPEPERRRRLVDGHNGDVIGRGQWTAQARQQEVVIFASSAEFVGCKEGRIDAND
jgi:hypothetical protein